MTKVNLPYGIDNFEKLRTSGCYYMDKTGFIKELVSENYDVNLITRPRRFGKTLMMSMLAEFFDIRKDSKAIFKGLEAADDPKLCGQWMNRWPVLALTLKDVDGDCFADAYGMLKYTIASLCVEHSELGRSEKVEAADREIFERLMYQRGNETDVRSALYTLSRMMKDHYGQNVILLVDEYDVPLAKASDHGYYKEMLNIIKTFLGMAWKSNPSLQFAVITGCLRIAKESIFTGANNFITSSISDKRYQRYFGFTEAEVERLLSEAGLLSNLPEMKRWYDGYLFGEEEIYCPWDVINHVRALTQEPGAAPGNYWLDTSHNNIIRKFLDLPDLSVNDSFEQLLSGGVIQEPVREDLTYDIAHSSEENIWSILYLTGYLTQAKEEAIPRNMKKIPGFKILRIPNEEVNTVFGDTVRAWFEDRIAGEDRRAMFEAWWAGDDEKLTQMVSDLLFETISYFDYKEDFYHAFVAGLFSGAGYEVKSNSEQGMGRADLIVKERRRRRAIVIEVKWLAREGDLEKQCQEALEQIAHKQYAKNLELEGFKTILSYGAAFSGKACRIKRAR